MSVVIKVESVSKQYRLGQVGTGSLSHDVNRIWHKMRGKEDPYLKIGDENDRSKKGSSEYVWALRDINFDVMQGEVMGIIGSNGAGKSTLLKILSRTTTPTIGSIKVKGRIASLLEVGTGFHPELSGRDNIFLNGAILGMTKNEIKRKFDEIVDFAGVDRYIDTPVKRYSSGMYVRLAFAVAAHLEPEILIVDEVLAVGDAEFQKKCLGKMKDVSVNDGRTVLFVSHNMAAIAELCNSCVVLVNGQKVYQGSARDSISRYRSFSQNLDANELICNETNFVGNDFFALKRIAVTPQHGENIDIQTGFNVDIDFLNFAIDKTVGLSIVITNEDEIVVFEAFSLVADNNSSKKGNYIVKFSIPGNLLNSGRYYVNLIFAESQRYVIFDQKNIISFMIDDKVLRSGYNLERIQGVIRPAYEVELKYKEI